MADRFNSQHTIHIINPFQNASGGSEWRALSLYQELKSLVTVKLWATSRPDPRFKHFPIQTIDLCRLRFPKSGSFIIVGIYFKPGRWINFARPQRTILIVNTHNKRRYRKVEKLLSGFFRPRPELVFASAQTAAFVGEPGVVHASTISLERFTPQSHRMLPDNKDDFVVGRMSRDVPYKHHPHDPAFYKQLAELGIKVKVMGGECLQTKISDCSGVELLPACSLPAEQFLKGLDVFFFCTAPYWTESFGRVIFEAMACGLPVVVENRGGYPEAIEHGRNGFLFQDHKEALSIIKDLKDSPALRFKIGQAARKTVEAMYSADKIRDVLEYYLRQ
jgi:glycosyltransferase involved in cell wall biosynthesis